MKLLNRSSIKMVIGFLVIILLGIGLVYMLSGKGSQLPEETSQFAR